MFRTAPEIERLIATLPHPERALALWKRSQPEPPAAGEGFLNPVEIRLAGGRLGFPPDLIHAVVASAERVSADPLASRYARFCRQAITDTSLAESLMWLPASTEDPLFPALIFFSVLPSLSNFYQERRIPPAVLDETLSDLLLWIRHYHDPNGRWGVGDPHWLTRHFAGRVFQLGRLQFELSALHIPWYLFRNRSDGSKKLLAADGQDFRDDGQFADADNIKVAAAWKSTLSISEAAEGFPVNARGVCAPTKEVLSFADWELTGKPGDPAIAVHIPATGPMDPVSCRESFARAQSFFQGYFPEFAAVAYTCDSWLLDPQLEEILPPESNIVRFLKLWTLHPLPGANANQTYERVFGATTWPPAAETVRTTLQKSIVKFIQNGGRLRIGGGVMWQQK